MKKRIFLIRHGATAGNLEKRYVGRTDEGLTEESVKILESYNKALLPDVQKVYVSPLARCRETAMVLFPQASLSIVDGLIEMDFGEYEYKNYEDLKSELAYQKFIESSGRTAFPGGEDMDCFQARCVKAFNEIMALEETQVAFVIHGGTIMAILDEIVTPHKAFYEWQLSNGEGYVIDYDSDTMLYSLYGVFDGSDIRRS